MSRHVWAVEDEKGTPLKISECREDCQCCCAGMRRALAIKQLLVSRGVLASFCEDFPLRAEEFLIPAHGIPESQITAQAAALPFPIVVQRTLS